MSQLEASNRIRSILSYSRSVKFQEVRVLGTAPALGSDAKALIIQPTLAG